MKWRNPKEELPKPYQIVWLMLEPHKDRGSLFKSALSIQIVCGQAVYGQDGKLLEIQNQDELGQGNIGWGFTDVTAFDEYQEKAVAWMPVEEMFDQTNDQNVVTPDQVKNNNVKIELLRNAVLAVEGIRFYEDSGLVVPETINEWFRANRGLWEFQGKSWKDRAEE